jgi:hypothetical protein
LVGLDNGNAMSVAHRSDCKPNRERALSAAAFLSGEYDSSHSAPPFSGKQDSIGSTIHHREKIVDSSQCHCDSLHRFLNGSILRLPREDSGDHVARYFCFSTALILDGFRR